MRIALINDTLYPEHKGGAPKRVWYFAKGLLNAGYEPHIYSMNYLEKNYPVRRDGVFIHGVCPVLPLYMNYKRTISQAINYSVALAKALFTNRIEYGAVYCTNFPIFPAIVASVYCHIHSIPLILDWYEFWDKKAWQDYMGNKGRIGWWLELLCGKLTKYNLADGNNVAEAMRQNGIKVYAVANDGVDLKWANTNENIKQDYDVVYLGKLLAHKNVGLLINAIAKGGFKGLIIGGGECYNELRDLARELKADVAFKGTVENEAEVCSYLQRGKVFVHPSIREGCGLAYVEAMACKLPVVSILDGNVVESGINGYICKNDVDDMVDKIKLAIQFRDRLSAGAWATAQRNDWHYSQEVLANTVKDATK